METEQARHETEESLISSQFGTSRNIPHKLQNGGQSSESDSLENAGDTNWNRYKSSAGANSMKRHRENCNSPASVQGLFDQGPYTMNGELMNGELKHALNEQSLMTHQPKKLKVDSEMRGNDDITSSLVDSFPELTKATEFERNSPQTEIKLDNRNFNFPNGDIFGLPRNKQGSIPNGAESPPSNIEGTPGDLLEKTLSQYYPEQVSIAPQTSGQQLDAVNGLLTNKLPSESSQPLLTSGMPNLAQMPDSQQQRPANQEFNQNSFLERNAPPQAAETGGYGHFPNSGIQKMGQSEEPRSIQHQHHGNDRGQQYEIQAQTFKRNAGNSHGADSTGPMGPSRQQPHHAGLENGMEDTSELSPDQRAWAALSSSHSQEQAASALSSRAQEQGMWRGFPVKPQSEQQIANPRFTAR
ncbi:hypothetical protein F7725_005916 [Dissostichus mawsoni]|uniref:Uncharacterized protein n=1 Tax=Dissostichus mawsoni TaxID=36200 RepID=A0A7J5YUQ4_DISMA|nr:hypothetical protein F7725_005916 [Dissostichus mawsoni]